MHTPTNNNSETEKRKARWDEIQQEVGALTDTLGKGIDEGIKPAVIAFRALDFPTSQSCEGHIRETDNDDQWGETYPWIEVYAPEPEGWEDSPEIQQQWNEENLKEQQRMIILLDEFYQNRDTAYDTRLILRDIGLYGGFRVQSAGGAVMKLLSLEEQANKYTVYRKELDGFVEFLKQKYWSE